MNNESSSFLMIKSKQCDVLSSSELFEIESSSKKDSISPHFAIDSIETIQFFICCLESINNFQSFEPRFGEICSLRSFWL